MIDLLEEIYVQRNLREKKNILNNQMEEFLREIRIENNADKFPLNVELLENPDKFYTLFVPTNEAYEAMLDDLGITEEEFEEFPALEALEKFHIVVGFHSEGKGVSYVTTLNGMEFEDVDEDGVKIIDGVYTLGPPSNFMTDEDDEFGGGLNVYFIEGILSTKNVTSQLEKWAKNLHSEDAGDSGCNIL